MVLATTCGASRDSWAEVRGAGAARLEAADSVLEEGEDRRTKPKQ